MKRLVLGPQAVMEALRSAAAGVTIVFLSDRLEPPEALHALMRTKRVPFAHKSAAELDLMCKGLKHQGFVAVTGEYSYRPLAELLAVAATPPLLVVCDQIQDPHNLGAIVRSAVCFGATGVVIGKERSAQVSAGTVRASAGATEHARIARVTNIAETLRALCTEGLRSVGLDADATVPIGSVDLTGPCALVVGGESKGLRRLVRERCDLAARIPMAGPLGSLNASVACAIALYDAHVQRNPRDRTRSWEE